MRRSAEARAPSAGSCSGASAGRALPRAEARSDADLIEAITGGDREALAELYERFAPLLLALAGRLLRTPEEAEDTVQDVFLEVWRHVGDYVPARGSVAAWLSIRTRCRALDRLKTPSRARNVRLVDEEDRPLDAADLPDWDPAPGLDGAMVWRKLAELPAEQRVVLGLAYSEGLTMSEISERLAIPIGTVKSRLARAASALREMIGDDKIDRFSPSGHRRASL